jgi:hypothetical protein
VRLYTPLLDEQGRIPHEPERQNKFMETCGIPAQILEELETRFGEHDWRHPLTHAVAWAYTGATLRKEEPATKMAQRLFRQIYFGLFIHGNIQIDETNGHIVLQPDFDRLKGVLAGYTQNIYSTQELDISRQAMERILQILVGYDHIPAAQSVYRLMQERYPDQYTSMDHFEQLAAKPQTVSPRIIPLETGNAK